MIKHSLALATTAIAVASSLVLAATVHASTSEPAPQAIAIDGQTPEFSDRILRDSPEDFTTEAGDHHFACVRIPAMLKVNGVLIASWNSRSTGCADYLQGNSISAMTSTDDGQTWSDATLLMTNDDPYYLDPAIVADHQANKVFLFAVKTSRSLGQIFRDPDADPLEFKTVYIQGDVTSDGVVWDTTEHDVTPLFTQPPSPTGNTLRWAAGGEGIQLTTGEHAGRLVVQFALFHGQAEQRQAISLLSDDHGQTWYLGNPTGADMDENKVVELADGRLMLNSRVSDRRFSGRFVTYSEDGGVTWGSVSEEHQLIDPGNNAAIIRAFPEQTTGAKSQVLLFTNAHHQKADRQNGTIAISYDSGTTWKHFRQFTAGSMQYSTIYPIGEGRYAMFYEVQNSTGLFELHFATFNWAWLTNPATIDQTIDSDALIDGQLQAQAGDRIKVRYQVTPVNESQPISVRPCPLSNPDGIDPAIAADEGCQGVDLSEDSSVTNLIAMRRHDAVTQAYDSGQTVMEYTVTPADVEQGYIDLVTTWNIYAPDTDRAARFGSTGSLDSFDALDLQTTTKVRTHIELYREPEVTPTPEPEETAASATPTPTPAASTPVATPTSTPEQTAASVTSTPTPVLTETASASKTPASASTATSASSSPSQTATRPVLKMPKTGGLLSCPVG